MEIKRLNCDVISKIRSSFNIEGIAQCVFELVCNSLDAKSTSIAVRINLITFKIQVADNGEGITKENLELLGIRYMTNKCHNLTELQKNLNTYGFRGEALSSIVQMSKRVSISSRYKNSPETYSTTLCKDLRSNVKLTKHRASVGTTVTILEFLSNLPVRRQRIIQEIELEEVKKYIESLVIINPVSSFTLRNDVSGLLILNSRKSDDIISSFRRLHPDITDYFSLIKVSKNKVSIDALIHKEFILSKKYQYVYVNKRPVINHQILKNFNESFYKKMQLETKRKKHPILDTKRYPVFVLNVKCPQSYVDIFMGPSKSDVEFKCCELVLTCIEKIIKTFFGLDDDKKEKVAPERKVTDTRVSCGVSQVLGAVQACAYKRKSDDAISEVEDNHDENFLEDTSQNKPSCIKKIKLSRMERKEKGHKKKSGKNKVLQSFVRDKTTFLPSQRVESSGNYQIEDTGRQKPFLKPRKLKSIIKKPLPIRIEQRMPNLESKLNKKCMIELETTTKSVQGKRLKLADSKMEDYAPIEQPIVQFDQKSVYSRLNNDEDKGKDLIMDMFLKSTQVFTGELSNISKKTCPNISCDTIEESNFVMENNIQDTVRGINTTMSISVNVKKKKIKNQKKKASKHVQTSLIEDRLTSKCVQTSQKPTLERVRSNMSDLTHQFDGFKLSHEYHDSEKDNYTILINTVRKKREFRFVRKSEEMDVDNSEEEKSFRPLKICQCREDDGKIFKFGPGKKREVLRLNDRSNFCSTGALKSLFEKPSNQQMANTVDKGSSRNDFLNREHSETIFKKPQPPAINELQPIYLQKQKVDCKTRTNNLNFRGVRKHTGPRQVEQCEKSPFFSKMHVERQPSTFDNNNFESRPDFLQPSYKNFQPRFKSNVCQNYIEPNVPRNIVVSSPYFARNSKESNVYLPRTIKNNYFEPYNINNQMKNHFNEGFPTFNPNQVHPNQYRMENYHNFELNCPPTHHCMNNYIANENLYHMRYVDDYGRHLNTNNMPRSCCHENMCPSENLCQYLEMPRHHINNAKTQNCFKQTFNRCKEDIWHRNQDNNNVGPRAKSISPQSSSGDLLCGDLAMNTEIQISKLPPDCNVQINKNVNVLHENTIVKDIHFENNDTQSLQPLEENGPNSLEEAPWYTPNVSDENMYFDRSLSKLEEPRPNKNALGFVELQSSPTLQNSGDIDENRNKIDKEKKPFNFHFSCTPDIFSSSEVVRKTARSSEKNIDINVGSGDIFCDPDKRRLDFQEPTEHIPDDFNAFFDLTSFGIVESKDAVRTTNTVCSLKEGSDLEITVLDDQQKQDIIKRELVDVRKNNGKRFLSGESAVKIDGRKNDGEKCTQKSRVIVDSQNEWVRKCNVAGKGFYVNKRTGMVTLSTPKIDEGFFIFDRRLDFVPKGMSPVLKKHKKIDRSLSQNAKSKLHDFILESYENELMVIKWQHFIYDDPKTFFEEIYKEKSKLFENGIPSMKDSVMKNKLHKDMVGFDSKMFKTIEIIGQVDRKFIAVMEKTKKMVVLFDQHAVHERIRVEKLLKEYKGLRTSCKEKFTFFMPRNDLNLLKKHSEYLGSLGLDVEFFTNGLKILNIPLCVQEKFKSKDNSEDLSKIISMLINEIIDSLKETRGSTSQLPKIIQNVLNLRACRGAIKFGDSLTSEDCIKLLNDLSKCNLPFQCAHGRPTLTPVLTLSKIDVRKKIKKLDFKKLLR